MYLYFMEFVTKKKKKSDDTKHLKTQGKLIFSCTLGYQLSLTATVIDNTWNKYGLNVHFDAIVNLMCVSKSYYSDSFLITTKCSLF
jgi:hypothetical protein